MSGALPLLQVFIGFFFIIFIAYLVYLIITKAFREMGFSPGEALIIVFVAYLFSYQIYLFGVNISNIHLFSYGSWHIFINTGGGIIPILLSIYLIIKKRLSLARVIFGVGIVTIVTYSVTYPVLGKGIVSPFPYFLLPAIFASAASIIVYLGDRVKAPPLAYVSGTIGVLIGADFLHLPTLLSYTPSHDTAAVIGGAVVLDMIFITGILAVFLDSLLLVRKKREEE